MVAFAGNLGYWYGKMLEQLISASLASQSEVAFKIYGATRPGALSSTDW